MVISPEKKGASYKTSNSERIFPSMGGVDLHDMLVELYRVDIRVKRYYLRIIFHIIDMCVVNAWLLYRRHFKQLSERGKPISLLNFKLCIAHALLSAGKDKTRKNGRENPSTEGGAREEAVQKKTYRYSAKPVEDVRYDCYDHWPEPTNDKKRCKLCIKMYSQTKCSKCNLYLCLNQKRNCFVVFHKKQ